ncbi:unnamed protein product [Cylindrotheca closterium]|uniref:Uncharacterized protein n=1 Tax=Cylindrotheca closterium TaxID=2856 RepID=A0AAD2FWC0_9STRA|nr:unnamed protein product [Cylindrotheca closterium]
MIIQTGQHNHINLASSASSTLPPPPPPIATSTSTSLQNRQNSRIPNSSIPSLGRQLKRLRDSNTSNQAQAAVLALQPIVHNWMQTDSKQKASAVAQGSSSVNTNDTFPDALDFGNTTTSKGIPGNTPHHSSIPPSTFRADTGTPSSFSSSTNAGEHFQQLRGVPILVLAFKEWESCSVVVSTILRILANLLHREATIAHALVEMGGLRTIVRAISKQHESKNETVFTACVALLSELAQHMPSTAGSDACLALVVHSLWRFPTNGYLQGFGCLFMERVLLPKLLLWGVSKPTTKPLPPPSGGTTIEGDSPGNNEEVVEEEDAWSITTIHQEDTLQKVVVPLLIRMTKYHHGSNPALCQTAEHLFHCINERLNNNNNNNGVEFVPTTSDQWSSSK